MRSVVNAAGRSSCCKTEREKQLKLIAGGNEAKSKMVEMEEILRQQDEELNRLRQEVATSPERQRPPPLAMSSITGCVVMVLALGCVLFASQPSPRAAVYTGEGAGPIGKANDQLLLHRFGFEVDSLTADQIPTSLKSGKHALIMFPGGNGDEMLASLGEHGSKAVRAFVGSGGGFVGFCGGAQLAMYLNLTAFENIYPPTLDLGFGAIHLSLSTNEHVSEDLQVNVGVSSRDVALHSWDYAGGAVMQLAKRQSTATSDPQVLFQYAGGLPSHAVSKGKIASGFSMFNGSGRVFVSGPHLDIDFKSQHAPLVGSLENSVLAYVVRLVSHNIVLWRIAGLYTSAAVLVGLAIMATVKLELQRINSLDSVHGMDFSRKPLQLDDDD